MKLSALGSPPAAFARNQFITLVYGPNQDRLEHTALGNRGCQLGQRLVVK
jgi:hypothetical protein